MAVNHCATYRVSLPSRTSVRSVSRLLLRSTAPAMAIPAAPPPLHSPQTDDHAHHFLYTIPEMKTA